MGRGMVRSAILLVLIWNLAVRASPTTYTMLPLGLLMASPDSYVGRRILTTGIYQVRTQSTYAVDGWLEERQSLIRIVGPIFDWQPVAGIRIDAWGVFRRDGASGELFLDYFNGRRAGDHLRNPRLTSILSLGRTVWLAGRLRQTGSEPIVRWTLLLEDRTQVDLKDFPLPGQLLMSGSLIEVQCQVEAGAFPPSQAAVRVLRMQPLPGPAPPPFGGSSLQKMVATGR